MSKVIDIEDFRLRPDKEKFDIIYDLFVRINTALSAIPSNSLGENEVRYWFDNKTAYPKGYVLANGSAGTFDPANKSVPIVPLQKLT